MKYIQSKLKYNFVATTRSGNGNTLNGSSLKGPLKYIQGKLKPLIVELEYIFVATERSGNRNTFLKLY